MKPPIPERIRGLQPYKPGKPIEEVERELGLHDSIKLASNENPRSPSPRVLDALSRALPKLNRYPDGGAVELTAKLAARLGVEPERIVLGNGSNEIIELLVRMFAGSGDEVVLSADAFLVYRLCTVASGATPRVVPARDYRHDLDALGDAIGDATRLVFLANPNNPTGTIFGRAEWERFLARVPEHVVVAVDEAYFEYVDDADYPNSMDYHSRHPGLVTLRTFSKIHALAGVRLGYGVGAREIIDAMARLRQPFNVNSLAQVAALAALDDEAFVRQSREAASAGRTQLAAGLRGLGMRYVPSHANFVLVEVGDGAAVTDALLHRGVIVRPMQAYGFPTMIRVTCGTQQENERFLAALAAVCAEGSR